MTKHITAHRGGFETGWNEVLGLKQRHDDAGLALAILRLEAGERFEDRPEVETAWLLLDGAGHWSLDGRTVQVARHSLFEQAGAVAHLCRGAQLDIQAEQACELACLRTINDRVFEPRLFSASEVREEVRGQGSVDGAATRVVRTVFDDSNSSAEARLVLGEVVHAPGRWSSYPPHHHPQPELYHYRFTAPQGYGHAELGDDVLRVQNNDTVKILDAVDHAQVAAPGYGMYYIWAIRHLDDARYVQPEFTEAHRWTLDPDAPQWRPPWSAR
ncbi:MAG: 5-deoxy-glucuronate isomerase [Pseudomonadota bacterium]